MELINYRMRYHKVKCHNPKPREEDEEGARSVQTEGTSECSREKEARENPRWIKKATHAPILGYVC